MMLGVWYAALLLATPVAPQVSQIEAWLESPDALVETPADKAPVDRRVCHPKKLIRGPSS